MTKIDVAFVRDKLGNYDIDTTSNGDLVSTDGFDTSINMSILCERRADASEVPNVLRRRGWIGNQYSDIPGFEIGSKFWIYDQARMNNNTLNGIKDASLEGVEWFLEDNLAVKTDATIEKVDNKAVLLVTLEASNGVVEQSFFELWRNTGSAT